MSPTGHFSAISTMKSLDHSPTALVSATIDTCSLYFGRCHSTARVLPSEGFLYLPSIFDYVFTRGVSPCSSITAEFTHSPNNSLRWEQALCTKNMISGFIPLLAVANDGWINSVG